MGASCELQGIPRPPTSTPGNTAASDIAVGVSTLASEPPEPAELQTSSGRKRAALLINNSEFDKLPRTSWRSSGYNSHASTAGAQLHPGGGTKILQATQAHPECNNNDHFPLLIKTNKAEASLRYLSPH